MNADCPACAAAALEPFADLGKVPVASGVTYPELREALASPAARMELAVCPACGHVCNVAFDQTLIAYDANYDNSLHHSHVFQVFADGLAQRLAREYDLEHKHIVELGCGKGHFLVELCHEARARGTGYDPSYDDDVTAPNVTFVRDMMPWNEPPEFDFFVSRHVVEHLNAPHEFLTNLRRACGRRPVRGYIEVPDAVYDFDRSPWNCHYPHVSYFSATSLARLAIRAGFAVLRLIRSFEGQYLSLEVAVNMHTPDETPVTGMGVRREREILAAFKERYPQIVASWRERLEKLGHDRCVVWGAGAKGLGFVNAVDPERRIPAVVDLNPGKWGHYLPVTGHAIVAPNAVAALGVTTVVITNPAYQAEIRAHLMELGVEADIVSAH